MRVSRAVCALFFAIWSCGASSPLPAASGSASASTAGGAVAPAPPPSKPAPALPVSDPCVQRLRALSGRVARCGEAAHRLDPRTAGSTAVRLAVSQGSVSGLVVLDDTTGDAAYVGCIERSLRGANFQGLSCSVPRYTWNLVAAAP
jgi:hypothetical protein